MIKCLTKRMKDSLTLSFAIITGFATVFTVIGFSLKDLLPFNCVQPAFLAVIIRAIILILIYVLLTWVIWFVKGRKYKNTINLKIGSNNVTLKPGNIFEQDAWRVIAVDTHFSTNVDDAEISKTSLHGQLVLEHGNEEDIKTVVKNEAERRKNKPDENGQYTFPLGTAIHYEGSDGHYIMVALTDLDADYEAHTKMPQYESTLMNIWHEISRVYAKNDLALPILGAGITRFDDGQDDPVNLLRCMLCTLNTSKVHFKSNVSVMVYDGGDIKENTTEATDNNENAAASQGNGTPKKKSSLPLYEYKDLYRIVR